MNQEVQKRTNQHQKKYQKWFLWCHVKHINSVQTHPERITKNAKKVAKDLDYDEIEFPVKEKGFSKTETKKQHLH